MPVVRIARRAVDPCGHAEVVNAARSPARARCRIWKIWDSINSSASAENLYNCVVFLTPAPRTASDYRRRDEDDDDRLDDAIASYNSKGPTHLDLTAKPDLVAPGNLVDSLLSPGSTLSAEYPGNIVAASEFTNGYASGPLYFRLSGNEHGDARGRRRSCSIPPPSPSPNPMARMP
jgi:hypothetical protein